MLRWGVVILVMLLAGLGSSTLAAGPQASSDGPAPVIELHADAALRFTDPSGRRVADIAVVPGETVVLRVTNTAGFDQNLYIGTDEELATFGTTTATGIPTWQSGVRELTWTVPADVTGLRFGCTVPGHYAAGMSGTFSAVDVAPAVATDRLTYDTSPFVPVLVDSSAFGSTGQAPERVEAPHAGFSLTLPAGWVWAWSQGSWLDPTWQADFASVFPSLADVGQAALEWAAASALDLVAFSPERPDPDICYVRSFAEPDASLISVYLSLMSHIEAGRVEGEISLTELPAGPALYVDYTAAQGEESGSAGTYYLTDGSTVYLVGCFPSDPSEDPLPSFAEAFEFLAEE